MTYWQEVEEAKARYESALAKAKAIWVESDNNNNASIVYEQARLVAESNYDSELSILREHYLK